MKDSLITKLEALADRHQEVSALLGDAETAADQNRSGVIESFNRTRWFRTSNGCTLATSGRCEANARRSGCRLRSLRARRVGGRASARSGVSAAGTAATSGPSDGNVYLEIRAGTGGDEAAIFPATYWMYHRYRTKGGLLKCYPSAGEHGGYKELITRVVGQDVYSHLKFESERIACSGSPNRVSGRIHTSACTVAVLPRSRR